MSRLEVLKTYKIYIGGNFPRTESGRYYTLNNKEGATLANVCLSSRKDVRNAVQAGRKAFGSWSERTAFNRSQIVYRIAEMLEGRKAQFIDELKLQGLSDKKAKEEVHQSIDRIIYYAGWCDKYNQITSTVNPVSSSHFNFSSCEAMGLVGIIAPESTSLLGMVSLIIPAICGGNTVLCLASESKPLCSITFAEVLNSSDVPGGVVNILTGKKQELVPVLASHMDVNALSSFGLSSSELKEIQTLAVDNLKRIVVYESDQSEQYSEGAHFISDLQEIKTTWHPIEQIGGATNSY